MDSVPNQNQSSKQNVNCLWLQTPLGTERSVRTNRQPPPLSSPHTHPHTHKKTVVQSSFPVRETQDVRNNVKQTSLRVDPKQKHHQLMPDGVLQYLGLKHLHMSSFQRELEHPPARVTVLVSMPFHSVSRFMYTKSVLSDKALPAHLDSPRLLSRRTRVTSRS